MQKGDSQRTRQNFNGKIQLCCRGKSHYCGAALGGRNIPGQCAGTDPPAVQGDPDPDANHAAQTLSVCCRVCAEPGQS